MNRFLDRTAVSLTWRELLGLVGLFAALEFIPYGHGYLAGAAWIAAFYVRPRELRRIVADLRELPATYRAGWQGTKFRRKRSAREEHDESR